MKTNLILIVALFYSTTVSAQWYAGFKAGPTFSNYKSKTPWKEASNIGMNVGVTAFRKVNANFGFMAEVQYIQKGYYHKICNTITDKLNTTYLEIPIMVDYAFIMPVLKNFKGHATLGLYTAYWLSAKYKTEGFDNTSETFDFSKNKASRFDVGPNAGGRIEYILKNASLSLDLRYELGLIDLQKTMNDNTANTNRAFIIGLTYLKVIKP